jgi:hypothetical protein
VGALMTLPQAVGAALDLTVPFPYSTDVT